MSEIVENLDYDNMIGILPDECTRIPFWTENPNILFQSNYMFEFFPVESMSYEEKLNAVSRLVILLTVIGFILTRGVRLLIISAITLFSIHLLHFYQQNEKDKNEFKKNDLEKNDIIAEPFENPTLDLLKKQGRQISDNIFMKPNSSNPFSNVLMNDYDYNPLKKPAPPIGKTAVNATILDEAKQLVKSLNPDQPDIADKLFKDLGEQYTFEQSLRPFYSTASTTIPNDQDGFAKFCYGSMISCKDGNQFACARNLSRHTNN
jgi:hypothetical protein